MAAPHFVMAGPSSSRIVAASLALALITSCAVSSALGEPIADAPNVPTKHTSAPPQVFTNTLACTHELGPAGELRINGLATGLAVALEPPSRVRTFPYTARTILLAVGSDTPWWPFFGDGGASEQTLWEVPCDQPSELRQLLNIDDADFSWAAPDPSGGLYFSLGTVQRYDFAAGDYGPVSPAPMIQQCWMAEQPLESRAYVAGWVGDDRLLIHVGGPCGFEAEWEGGTAILELGGGGAQPARRQPSAYVGTIVADAAGRLWVGDGGQCAAPQTVWDRGEPGVWRSDDRGESWRFMAIPELGGAGGHGVDALWVSGDRVLAHAECCFPGPADGCDGGELLRSDDAGASWRDITPTRGAAAAEFPPSVVRVHVGIDGRLGPGNGSTSGSLDALEVTLDVDEQPAFASRDGGRKWTPLGPDAELSASPISRSATLGDSVFEATIDGVVEHRSDGSTRVVLRPIGAPTWWNGG